MMTQFSFMLCLPPLPSNLIQRFHPFLLVRPRAPALRLRIIHLDLLLLRAAAAAAAAAEGQRRAAEEGQQAEVQVGV